MESSPGFPLMHTYSTNAKLLESEDLIELTFSVSGNVMVSSVSMKEIVALAALWQTFTMCTYTFTSGLEAYEMGAVLPNRMFIKNEINPTRKVDAHGCTTPRGIVNESVIAQLSSTLIYPGTLGGFMPVLSNRMMIGFGVTRDIVAGVVKFVKNRCGDKAVVSDDIKGFEKNFSAELLALAAGIHSRNLKSHNSKLYMRNFALTRSDNVYVMPDGEIIRKKVPSLMPSGIILTTLFNCIGRLFLVFKAGGDGIVLGDDCVEWHDEVSFMVFMYIQMGIDIRDIVECVDCIKFCSASLYENGDHIPDDSSLFDSFVQALLSKTNFNMVVGANLDRCLGVEAKSRCYAMADKVAKLAALRGHDCKYVPSDALEIGVPVSGQRVYEAYSYTDFL